MTILASPSWGVHQMGSPSITRISTPSRSISPIVSPNGRGRVIAGRRPLTAPMPFVPEVDATDAFLADELARSGAMLEKMDAADAARRKNFEKGTQSRASPQMAPAGSEHWSTSDKNGKIQPLRPPPLTPPAECPRRIKNSPSSVQWELGSSRGVYAARERAAASAHGDLGGASHLHANSQRTYMLPSIGKFGGADHYVQPWSPSSCSSRDVSAMASARSSVSAASVQRPAPRAITKSTSSKSVGAKLSPPLSKPASGMHGGMKPSSPASSIRSGSSPSFRKEVSRVASRDSSPQRSPSPSLGFGPVYTPWKARATEANEVPYYDNVETGERVWTVPNELLPEVQVPGSGPGAAKTSDALLAEFRETNAAMGNRGWWANHHVKLGVSSDPTFYLPANALDALMRRKEKRELHNLLRGVY